MAIGIVLGTLIGIFTENMGAWLAIGVALGAGLGKVMSEQETEEQ